mmetsp:Transcript_26738/g.71530  ORF Transcript_26738/g.71530 Transcript_26738/m.71530 type:complete len:335 (+) Transcript_26738:332-1336(+)
MASASTGGALGSSRRRCWARESAPNAAPRACGPGCRAWPARASRGPCSCRDGRLRAAHIDQHACEQGAEGGHRALAVAKRVLALNRAPAGRHVGRGPSHRPLAGLGLEAPPAHDDGREAQVDGGDGADEQKGVRRRVAHALGAGGLLHLRLEPGAEAGAGCDEGARELTFELLGDLAVGERVAGRRVAEQVDHAPRLEQLVVDPPRLRRDEQRRPLAERVEEASAAEHARSARSGFFWSLGIGFSSFETADFWPRLEASAAPGAASASERWRLICRSTERMRDAASERSRGGALGRNLTSSGAPTMHSVSSCTKSAAASATVPSAPGPDMMMIA